MSLRIEEHSIYFLGIGGIGMSALARYFIIKGYKVHGYDRTPTSLTASLEKEGMIIHYKENSDLIPAETGLVIYTPAIPASNSELQYLQKSGVRMMKRAEVLGMLSSEYQTIACAGTHGKTTTSSMVSYLLQQSHVGCQAFLGGISRNFDSNLVISETSRFMVVEADEYDRSFHQLHPFIAIITSIDSDHLDIYNNLAAVHEAFSIFTGKIVSQGSLIIKKGLRLPLDLPADGNVYRYAVNEEADFYATDLRLINNLYHFDLTYPNGKINNLVLGIPGLYNVENAVAAMAAAILAGATPEEISKGLAEFTGVKRRFDIRVNGNNIVYIDDYAHHPEEMKACISSARDMFPDRKLTGIFQPHLYSRTRDFAAEFAQSLSLLDEVLLLPVYAARELPIPGIDSEMLLSLMNHPNKHLVQKADIPAYFADKHTEVLITMGAGDIDTLVEPIENFFMTTNIQ
ncbi:MAG: UDP-N-acetylmuramate--L-alanine ligase [Lentimicrobiaceae bacterium]|jgi:UDP-N-acetylmuramate--alanine ligase